MNREILAMTRKVRAMRPSNFFNTEYDPMRQGRIHR
jgi:hypothetical protein